MRKLLFVFFLIVGISCSTKTNDDIIETAFNNYVKLNFDDPSLLKEFVGITYGDTVTNQFYADMLDELSVMNDSLDKMKNVLADKAIELVNNNGKKVNHNLVFLEDWKDFQELLNSNKYKIWEYASSFMSNDFQLIQKDSILNYKDFALLDFKVKYRILEGESLKLKEQQGFYDLKSSTVFWNESVNDTLLNILKSVNKTAEYYKSMIEMNADVVKKSQKIISYFE